MKGVRLAIDAVGALHGGAARVAISVSTAAARADAVESVVSFLSPAKRREFELPLGSKMRAIDVGGVGTGAARLGWLMNGLGRACRREGATHVLLLSGGGWVEKGVRAAVFIQQSLPFLSEASRSLGVFGRMRVAAISAVMKSSATRAGLVIVQTETMKNLVVQKFRLPASLVRVCLAGVPGDMELRQRSGSSERACEGVMKLLYVGNSAPYKNLGVLGEALEIIAASGREAKLVATVDRRHPIACRRDVDAVGMVGRERLFEEYRKADALILPSLAETVGLPLLEAMALAVPVIAADRPYAREICGPAALYFDPFDARALATAIGTVRDNQEARAAMRKEGLLRAEGFTSERMYDNLIHSLVTMPSSCVD